MISRIGFDDVQTNRGPFNYMVGQSKLVDAEYELIVLCKFAVQPCGDAVVVVE